MAAAAQFELRKVFRLSHGPFIVFAGHILDGTVHPGMEISLELQPRLSCSCEILSIEYVDYVTAGETLVGLLCAETEPDEAELYADLCPPGTVLKVNG
jgi:hypothetical protein